MSYEEEERRRRERERKLGERSIFLFQLSGERKETRDTQRLLIRLSEIWNSSLVSGLVEMFSFPLSRCDEKEDLSSPFFLLRKK